jgi:xanthine/uracil permease
MNSSDKSNSLSRLPLSIPSMILGFLSCVMFGIITAIPAIVLGHISLSKHKKNPEYKGRKIAIAGIILGYLGIFVTLAILLRFLSIYYGYEK